ncbi:sterol response element binding protein cleavage-activating protein [Rhizoclosmatium globosum]|uniref:Sterol response element binding protein cleavage-activating protein n=1 Tax=Rhizoclosmatium globosum TaxID=329046 RepID=A0A1Y2BSC7_9FUNG|nr:sterol response element binding protein cleavage-activating protein [Rhizoclosmatium globosum]|eukprot:ORY37662.1 sterol response element binding protein cleavage-activating protein [Rhizoclosmatium globosum]
MDDVFSVEYAIVLLSYIIVFFYISLVLGRVELVKSKFGLGMGAVIMVFSSLTMSVGLTSWMGVTSTLVPWEVLPFLIIAIGVENIFVMTNAVVTSSIDLPVRERVGIGLSKVGAKMTSKVFHELCLLVLVSLINVPALQEFCLFATVAVVIDFMMQITFFTTILSIDIRRLEPFMLAKVQSLQRTLVQVFRLKAKANDGVL